MLLFVVVWLMKRGKFIVGFFFYLFLFGIGFFFCFFVFIGGLGLVCKDYGCERMICLEMSWFLMVGD